MLPSRRYYLDSIFDDFMSSVDNFDDMKCDIYEKGDIYYIEASLPDYNKEDIVVELEDGYLTITAIRNSENDNYDDDRRYIRKERVYGKTTRKFYIGMVEENKISAKFDNGILEIVIPKEESKVDKKIIEIK